MIRPLLVCALALGLCACAAKNPWTNPNVPKGQWESDWSACKDQASARAGVGGGGGYDPGDQRVPDPFAEYDRQSRKSEVDDAVTSCMIGLGYLPTRRKR